MKSVVLLILCFCHIQTAKAQPKTFTDKCLGTWQGYLMIYNNGTLKDSVESRFTVEKLNDSSWVWRTEYAGKEPIVKDYVLRLKDESIGHYIIDEQDGIELETRLVGNALFSMFEVGGKLLTSTYEFEKDQILFEITVGIPSVADTEGQVKNYTVSTIQRATLTRIK